MIVESNIVENWGSKQRNDTMPLSCCSIYLVKGECDVTLKAPMSMVVMRMDRTIERLLEVDLI